MWIKKNLSTTRRVICESDNMCGVKEEFTFHGLKKPNQKRRLFRHSNAAATTISVILLGLLVAAVQSGELFCYLSNEVIYDFSCCCDAGDRSFALKNELGPHCIGRTTSMAHKILKIICCLCQQLWLRR